MTQYAPRVLAVRDREQYTLQRDNALCEHAGCQIHKKPAPELHRYLSAKERAQIYEDVMDGWSPEFTAAFYGISHLTVRRIVNSAQSPTRATRSRRKQAFFKWLIDRDVTEATAT